ncbi:hypothetical protein [Kineosporia succinea]|uniref:DUF5648 domain-containing protein n=1 Tax=Kineosporia succinea TaxID=84632 RepID=A0ABT9NX40_9ACTN|nr:hypothetical protein [Kineosporia succinea]MDP9824989.1 hypothetical protein [Kineosporia succinea]
MTVTRRTLLGLLAAPSPSGPHFYTTNPTEKRARLAAGYVDETDASSSIFVFTRPLLHVGFATVPLFRLYHPTTHAQLFATSAPEAARAVRDLGFRDETRLDSPFVLPVPAGRPAPPGAVPLLVARHPGSGDHLYTTSPSEMTHATAHLGYEPVESGIRPHVLSGWAMAEGLIAVRLHRLRGPIVSA